MSPSPPPWSPRCPGSSTGSASSARNLAEEKSKIAALIADVSHQTKTPIANLLLYASLLAENELTPEQRAQAEALKTQAEKLSFLVDALVKSSRLDNGILTLSPAPHPIQPLLDGAGRAGAGRRRTAWHFPHCPALGGRGPL